MGNYGINVSRPGYGVTDIPLVTPDGSIRVNTSQAAAYSSAWWLFKIVATGTVTMSIAATNVGPIGRQDTTTIAHNQAVTPMVGAYYSIDGGTTYRGWTNASTTTTTSNPLNGFWISSDSTNITINVFSYNLAAYTVNARYVVYADPQT